MLTLVQHQVHCMLSCHLAPFHLHAKIIHFQLAISFVVLHTSFIKNIYTCSPESVAPRLKVSLQLTRGSKSGRTDGTVSTHCVQSYYLGIQPPPAIFESPPVERVMSGWLEGIDMRCITQLQQSLQQRANCRGASNGYTVKNGV